MVEEFVVFWERNGIIQQRLFSDRRDERIAFAKAQEFARGISRTPGVTNVSLKRV